MSSDRGRARRRAAGDAFMNDATIDVHGVPSRQLTQALVVELLKRSSTTPQCRCEIFPNSVSLR